MEWPLKLLDMRQAMMAAWLDSGGFNLVSNERLGRTETKTHVNTSVAFATSSK